MHSWRVTYVLDGFQGSINVGTEMATTSEEFRKWVYSRACEEFTNACDFIGLYAAMRPPISELMFTAVSAA